MRTPPIKAPIPHEVDDLEGIAEGNIVFMMINSQGEFAPTHRFVRVNDGLMSTSYNNGISASFIYTFEELAWHPQTKDGIYWDMGQARPVSDYWDTSVPV
jgi:hypothetical protein